MESRSLQVDDICDIVCQYNSEDALDDDDDSPNVNHYCEIFLIATKIQEMI